MSRTFSTSPILGNHGPLGQEYFYAEAGNQPSKTRIHAYPAEWDDLENLEGQMPQLFIRGGRHFPEVTAKVSSDGLPDDDDIIRALNHFRHHERNSNDGPGWLDHAAGTLMERWLRIFYGMTEVTFTNWSGYSQGGWGWMLRGFTPEWLKAAGLPADYKRTHREPANLGDWLRSDFWYAEPQIRRSWTKTYDDGEEIHGEDWETPEAEGPVVIYGNEYDLFNKNSLYRYDPNTHWEILTDDDGNTIVASK